MAAYLVVQIDVKDQVEFENYKVMAPPTISAYGGKYLVRGGAMTLLEGDWKPSVLSSLSLKALKEPCSGGIQRIRGSKKSATTNRNYANHSG